MIDFESFFKDGSLEKGSFLSRVFGIFSEEIIRIWARDENSPYKIHSCRPTLYNQDKRYTLDFLLIKDGRSYVSEMKCEIQYRNYQFWRLESPDQLKHHLGKAAFELFLKLSSDPCSVRVKAGDNVDISGTILVWGSASKNGIENTKEFYSFSDILTIEDCVADLINWENSEYRKFLNEREFWTSSFFNLLQGKNTGYCSR